MPEKGAKVARVAVDLMGSDTDPKILLEGVEAALKRDQNLEVLVVGDASIVEPFAASHERTTALVSTEVIHMDEHPTQAVRAKKDASIVVASRAVKEGRADGLFSAGSTGAVLTAATFGIGRIKGIKRPALGAALPSLNGHPCVFLDMGANSDVTPQAIVQFARMGRAYSEIVCHVEDPKVALLSNGSEDAKGSEQSLSYFEALSAADVSFVGNCEGSDLLTGKFDVVVSDGFTGNVALKSLEGTAKFLVAAIKDASASSKKVLVGASLMKPALKKIAASLSGDEYGGAFLLGLVAPVVKGHGASSARAVENGCLVCADAIRGKLVDKIERACAEAE